MASKKGSSKATHLENRELWAYNPASSSLKSHRHRLSDLLSVDVGTPRLALLSSPSTALR